MLTTKIGRSTTDGQTACQTRSVRLYESPKNANWTCPMDCSRGVDQNSYIERPIWSSDERAMVFRRSAPRKAVRPPVQAVRSPVAVGIGLELYFDVISL